MIVTIFNEQTGYSLDLENLPRLVEEVLHNEECFCDEVVIHFVDEPHICDLHREFFDDPSPTDCITFPIDESGAPGYCMLGEVFVCPKAAFDYTSVHGGSPAEEVTLYVIHGLLHLMGYEDSSSKQRIKMKTAEKRHLDLAKEELLTLAVSV